MDAGNHSSTIRLGHVAAVTLALVLTMLVAVLLSSPTTSAQQSTPEAVATTTPISMTTPETLTPTPEPEVSVPTRPTGLEFYTAIGSLDVSVGWGDVPEASYYLVHRPCPLGLPEHNCTVRGIWRSWTDGIFVLISERWGYDCELSCP